MNRQRVVLRVHVGGIVSGHPPGLTWWKRARRPDGKEKIISQWVKVLDDQLLQQLTAAVATGDEIEIAVVTEWPEGDSYLAGFAKGDQRYGDFRQETTSGWQTVTRRAVVIGIHDGQPLRLTLLNRFWVTMGGQEIEKTLTQLVIVPDSTVAEQLKKIVREQDELLVTIKSNVSIPGSAHLTGFSKDGRAYGEFVPPRGR